MCQCVQICCLFVSITKKLMFERQLADFLAISEDEHLLLDIIIQRHRVHPSMFPFLPKGSCPSSTTLTPIYGGLRVQALSKAKMVFFFFAFNGCEISLNKEKINTISSSHILFY